MSNTLLILHLSPIYGILYVVKVKLTTAEKKAIKEEAKMRQVAALFLDLERDLSYKGIADEAGLTLRQVRYLTGKEQFQEIYAEHYSHITGRAILQVRHDIVAKALQVAYKEHLTLLEDGETPATVKMSAIREVYKLAGIEEAEVAPPDDRRELQEFQRGLHQQFTIEQVNIHLQALDKIQVAQDEPVDAEFQEIEDDSENTDDSHPPGDT